MRHKPNICDVIKDDLALKILYYQLQGTQNWHFVSAWFFMDSLTTAADFLFYLLYDSQGSREYIISAELHV